MILYGVCRVGQNHIYTVYILYTVFLAGKEPNIRSYTVYIYTVLANPRCMYTFWPTLITRHIHGTYLAGTSRNKFG